MYLLVFIQNLLVHLAEKILRLQPLTFRGDYRTIWRRWSDYHRRGRIESKMHCVKLPGQPLMARDFDRQVVEFQVRVAVLNGFIALSIFVTKAVGLACPGKRKSA